MKTTYLLLVLGLLCAVAYSVPIEEDEPLEDEFLKGMRRRLFMSLEFFNKVASKLN